MSTYDKTKVENFIVHFNDDPPAFFYFVAALERGSLLPVRVQHLVRDFDNLSPWEKANVMYEITDLIDSRLKHLREFYSKNARLADDEGWG